MPVTPVSAVAAAKPGSSDQSSRADDAEARLERLPVDPDALDRARRGALAGRDLGALEGRAGRRRGGEQAVAVAEHDLGVRADVDDELDDLATRAAPRRGSRRPCRRRRGRRCTAGRRPGRPGWVGRSSSSARIVTARSVARANGAEPSGIGSMPRRRWCMIGLPTIASSRIASRLIPARFASWARSPLSALADGRGHLARAAVVHHRVADPAHQVLAEPDLRVHHAGAGEDRAVAEVREVAGDRRRADVDRDAERPVVEARPDAGDRAPVVDRDGDRRTCPPRAPAGARGSRWRSASRSSRSHSRSSASWSRCEVAATATRAAAARPRRSGAGRPDRGGSRGRRGPCGRPAGRPGSRAGRR